MIKLYIVNVIIVIGLSLNCIGSGYATVINFDDLSQGLVPNGYAGLTWGTSILSRPYSDSTSFSVYSNQSYSIPHSSPNYIFNGYGVPDLWFEFPSPVDFKGAWFTAKTNNSYAAQKVRFVDDLGQTSLWLELTNTPQYLSANFSGSKKVYIQPTGVFSGIQTNGGWYIMDDITYEFVSSSVEHAFTITLTGTGNGAINSDPSGYIACSYSPQGGICRSTHPVNTSFTLIANPGTDSQFVGWGGTCSTCSGPYCGVTLDSDKSCTAIMDFLPLVQIAGPAFYASLGKAYAQLSEGDTATMQAQAVELYEDVDFYRNIPLTLLGGYDPSFSTCNGSTVLHGTMTITQGSLIVDNFIVK